jgi:hypothetical protein
VKKNLPRDNRRDAAVLQKTLARLRVSRARKACFQPRAGSAKSACSAGVFATSRAGAAKHAARRARASCCCVKAFANRATTHAAHASYTLR